MSRLVSSLVASSVCCVLAATTVPTSAQVPTLQRTTPLGIPAGVTTTLRLSGAGLTDIREIWTTFPTVTPVEVVAADPKAKADPTRAALRVHPTADAVPGIYALRIAAAGGVSNLRLLLIDDLPTVAEASTNVDPRTPQKLQPPIAVDGTCTGESTDYFEFHAAAGERLSFEVVAKRIASPLDPLLRLLDAKGNVLAEADDDFVVGADARLTYQFAAAGDYRLELRDIRYGGGAGHIYRLRVGDFPLVATPFPAAAAKGAKTEFEMTPLAPLGAAKSAKLDVSAVSVPKDYADAVMPLVAQYRKGQGSGFSSVLVSDKAERIEAEPNDAPKQATPLAVDGAMNGRFDRPRDRDYFKLSGKKGDKLRIAGRTRSLGSPTDLYLQLYDATGTKLLAETDDSGTDEGVLNATLDAAGDYLLAVEDLIGRGGPEFVYRLEVSPSKPGFTAAIDQEKFDVPYGGLATTKVTVVRSGYDGDIKFRVEGPPGIEVDGAVASGKTDGVVLLAVPPEYASGSLLNVRLIGEGADGVTAEVGSAAAQQKALGGTKLPPSLKEAIVLGVTAPSDAQFTLSSPTTAPKWNADGSQGELTVALERKKGFADVVKLQTYGLPTGYTAGSVSIAKDKKEGTIVIKGPAGVKPPLKAFFIVGTGVLAKKPVQGSLVGLSLAADESKPAAAKEPAAKKPTAKAPADAKKSVDTKKPAETVKPADKKSDAKKPEAKPAKKS